jgi:hypothetical protein
MGLKPDVEIANFLARREEMQARGAASPAPSSEWRWSRTGWGNWGAERNSTPEACTDATSDLAPSADGNTND